MPMPTRSIPAKLTMASSEGGGTPVLKRVTPGASPQQTEPIVRSRLILSCAKTNGAASFLFREDLHPHLKDLTRRPNGNLTEQCTTEPS